MPTDHRSLKYQVPMSSMPSRYAGTRAALLPSARRPAPLAVGQRPVAVGPYRALVRPLDEATGQVGEARRRRAVPMVVAGIPHEVAIVGPPRFGGNVFRRRRGR